MNKGDTLQVRGTGFEPGQLVTIEMCGNGALDATADCNLRASTQFAVRPTGEFFGVLGVALPPQPCPCVVRVTDQSSTVEVLAPIEVPEAKFVTAEPRVPLPDVSRQLRIDKLEATGNGPWTSWLGFPATRTVNLTVTNTGDTAVQHPVLSLRVGRGTNPAAIVPVEEIESIEPGQTVELSVPIRLAAPPFGEYTVRAEFSGAGEPVVARAQTRSYPWGLLVLILVVVQLGLLRLRNRIRRRVVPPEPETPVGELPPARPLELGPGPAAEAPVEAAGADASGPIDVSTSEDPFVDARRASAALRNARQLAEAVVAAAGIRASDIEARAASSEERALEREAQATALLAASASKADQLIRDANATRARSAHERAVSQETAALLVQDARAKAELARRLLEDASAQASDLISAARDDAAVVIERANSVHAAAERAVAAAHEQAEAIVFAALHVANFEAGASSPSTELRVIDLSDRQLRGASSVDGADLDRSVGTADRDEIALDALSASIRKAVSRAFSA